MDAPEHASVHMKQQMAMKRTVSWRVGGEIESELRTRKDVHCVLERVTSCVTVYDLEEVAM